MEAATNTIQELSQRVLPDTPHYLAYHPEWRYKPHNDRHPDKPVEWHNTRLQYMTLLSDADRGVLLTRSCYDMVEELQKPVPKEVTALSKGPEKKKLSLSDYKNKKTTGNASASPPDPAIVRRREADLAAVASRDKASPRSVSDNRHQRPTNGSHHLERTPSHGSADTKYVSWRRPESFRHAHIDRLPARPPTIHPLPRKPPSPEPRKRMPHPDDDSRPLKRTRPDSERSDRARPPRDDHPRRREPPTIGNAPQRDARTISSPALSNGGSRLKDNAAPIRNGSTATHSHSRNSSLNGIKSSHANSSSNHNTPLRNEATAKSFVPPLLSPLRMNNESRSSDDRDRRFKKESTEKDRDRDDRPRELERDRDRGREPNRDTDRVHDRERERERDRQRDREREQERDRKRDKDRERERSVDAIKSTKSAKAEHKSEKRPSSPPIPPLLDSTLKPEIEEAYRYWAKQQHSPSSEDEDENVPVRAKEKRKEPVPTKKRPLADISEDEDARPIPQRKSLIIRLKVPKRLRKDFGRIMRMSDTRQEREQRQERLPQSPVRESAPARKRPAVAEETAKDEPMATKRPRTSEVGPSHGREPPATPSKKNAIAMSRVSSTNSHVNTPGDPYPTPVDGEPNGGRSAPPRPPVSAADAELAARLIAAESHLLGIGKQLKHMAQERMNRAEPDIRTREATVRFGCVKYLESIIVFALAFDSRDRGRAINHMRPNSVLASSWGGMLPMFDAFRTSFVTRLDSQPRRTLLALTYLLQRQVVDEWTRLCVKSGEPDMREMVKATNQREKATNELRAVMNDAGSRHERDRDGGVLKGVDIPPWLSTEDLCNAAIKVLGRWCQDEKVDWKPKNLKTEAR